MKFWKDNKIDGEFDWPVQAVADAFCIAVLRDCRAVCGIAAHDPSCANPWKDKLCAWPLERVLRDWLTSPEGFMTSWEAETPGRCAEHQMTGPGHDACTHEESFEELFETVRAQLYGRGAPDYSVNHVG